MVAAAAGDRVAPTVAVGVGVAITAGADTVGVPADAVTAGPDEHPARNIVDKATAVHSRNVGVSRAARRRTRAEGQTPDAGAPTYVTLGVYP